MSKPFISFLSLLLVLLVVSPASSESRVSRSGFNKDSRINDYLIATSVVIPDYTLVVSNINKSFSLSPLVHDISAHLTTVNARTSVTAFPVKGMMVTRVLPPGYKLTVVKVYESKPAFFRALFASSTFFAVLEDAAGNKYTASVFRGEINLSNPSGSRRNKEWRRVFSALELTNELVTVHIGYYLKDKQGLSTLGKDLRPPYPAGMLDRSRKNMDDFISINNFAVHSLSKHHAYLSLILKIVWV